MTQPDHAHEDALRSLVTGVLTEHGLVLDGLESKRRGQELHVTVTVDLPEDAEGSVDLDTVTDVSRELSERLDADPSLLGDGPSTLDVTTPGVFRPLTELHHFKRSRSRLLTVHDMDGREFLGRLLEVDGDDLIFEVQKPPHVPKKKGGSQPPSPERVAPGPHRMPWTDVESASIELEFR